MKTGPPPGVDDKVTFAAKLGISVEVLSSYMGRNSGYNTPEPDGRIGKSPWWYETTVNEWIANRPGSGNYVRRNQPKEGA